MNNLIKISNVLSSQLPILSVRSKKNYLGKKNLKSSWFGILFQSNSLKSIGGNIQEICGYNLSVGHFGRLKRVNSSALVLIKVG